MLNQRELIDFLLSIKMNIKIKYNHVFVDGDIEYFIDLKEPYHVCHDTGELYIPFVADKLRLSNNVIQTMNDIHNDIKKYIHKLEAAYENLPNLVLCNFFVNDITFNDGSRLFWDDGIYRYSVDRDGSRRQYILDFCYYSDVNFIYFNNESTKARSYFIIKNKIINNNEPFDADMFLKAIKSYGDQLTELQSILTTVIDCEI